jgi:hypothetical protein
MKVKIGEVSDEGEHPPIDKDRGEYGNHRGIAGGIEYDPEDDQQPLLNPQTNQ